jgi:hypothetical protein
VLGATDGRTEPVGVELGEPVGPDGWVGVELGVPDGRGAPEWCGRPLGCGEALVELVVAGAAAAGGAGGVVVGTAAGGAGGGAAEVAAGLGVAAGEVGADVAGSAGTSVGVAEVRSRSLLPCGVPRSSTFNAVLAAPGLDVRYARPTPPAPPAPMMPATMSATTGVERTARRWVAGAIPRWVGA